MIDAEGQPRAWAQKGRARQLATRFGTVQVTRIAYRSAGRADLHPADAVSNSWVARPVSAVTMVLICSRLSRLVGRGENPVCSIV